MPAWVATRARLTAQAAEAEAEAEAEAADAETRAAQAAASAAFHAPFKAVTAAQRVAAVWASVGQADPPADWAHLPAAPPSAAGTGPSSSLGGNALGAFMRSRLAQQPTASSALVDQVASPALPLAAAANPAALFLRARLGSAKGPSESHARGALL
jgi:uncharacterized membrane protein YqiK